MYDDTPITRRSALVLGGLGLGGTALSTGAMAKSQDDGDDENGNGDGNGNDGNGDRMRQYRVTVANNTPGQPFTPPAVAAHRSSVEVFSVGDEANEPTRQVAENGNLGPLAELIEDTNAIRGAAVGEEPLVPQSDPAETGFPYYTTLDLSADASAGHLTFLSMLIATNDGIVGLDTVPLPERVNESRTYYANGYDVGTEQNTELFADLVPPAKTLILGGQPEGTTESDDDLEEDGVITPHPGVQGVGNLPPSVYDWSGPAAMLQVERVEED
jgi:hypothetical protein